jgi:DNA repair protein SbcD/Mre11
MKFLHLADLHLGKRLGDYDLSDVQMDMLDKLYQYVKENHIPVVVIAGDIYDTRDPSAKATNILDVFLSKLHSIQANVLMISGNHDQEDKLHFVSSILKNDGIHIITDPRDSLTPVTIEDVNFYLLPFVNKYDVRSLFPEEAENIESLSQAISLLISKMNLDKTKKNVLVSHQAILGSAGKLYASGSEVSVERDRDGLIGGEDIISSAVLKDFDYVALGHIHKTMNIEKNMRYPGALLKYHKDEACNKKSFTIVDTEDFHIEEIQIVPLHDVVLLRGSFEEIKNHKEHQNDYVFFELTDEEYILEPMDKLKKIFPYACGLSYIGKKTSLSPKEEIEYADIDKISKMDLFSDFYKEQMNEDLNDEQKQIVNNLIKEIWGE